MIFIILKTLLLLAYLPKSMLDTEPIIILKYNIKLKYLYNFNYRIRITPTIIENIFFFFSYSLQ